MSKCASQQPAQVHYMSSSFSKFAVSELVIAVFAAIMHPSCRWVWGMNRSG
jgi:hypothetical protein